MRSHAKVLSTTRSTIISEAVPAHVIALWTSFHCPRRCFDTNICLSLAAPILCWRHHMRLSATHRHCSCHGRTVYRDLLSETDLDWRGIDKNWTDGWHDYCMILAIMINIVGLSHSASEDELLLEMYLCMIMSLCMKTDPSALQDKEVQCSTPPARCVKSAVNLPIEFTSADNMTSSVPYLDLRPKT